MKFPTEKSVNKHIDSHHTVKICPYCKNSFKNKNTLNSHVFKCKEKPRIKTNIPASKPKPKKFVNNVNTVRRCVGKGAPTTSI